MFAPLLRALQQLDDPAFLRVVVGSVMATLAGFLLLAAGVWYGVHGGLGVNTWLAGLLGGVGAALLAHWLFLPVAALVASLFVEPVAAAVERRFYRDLPPPEPASLPAQLGDAVSLGIRLLLLQLAAVLATFVLPGGSLVLGLAIAAWAIGRGLFVAVAMRRMDRARARALYAAHRGEVLLLGVLAAAASLAPVLNLLVPVLAVAAMVHVLHASAPDRSAGLAVRRPV